MSRTEQTKPKLEAASGLRNTWGRDWVRISGSPLLHLPVAFIARVPWALLFLLKNSQWFSDLQHLESQNPPEGPSCVVNIHVLFETQSSSRQEVSVSLVLWDCLCSSISDAQFSSGSVPVLCPVCGKASAGGWHYRWPLPAVPRDRCQHEEVVQGLSCISDGRRSGGAWDHDGRGHGLSCGSFLCRVSLVPGGISLMLSLVAGCWCDWRSSEELHSR